MKELIRDYKGAYNIITDNHILKEELNKIFNSLVEQGYSYGQIYTGLYKAIDVIMYEYEIAQCL